MQNSMLHGSETWPVRKENEMALQRAVVRWMCGIKLKDRVSNKELREKLGIVDIMSLLQQTGYDGVDMCCKKRIMIGCRNVWSIKWKASDSKVGQRGHG